MHGKKLSGRAVHAVYDSPVPPRWDAAARLATFRGRVPAGAGGDGKEQGDEDVDRFVTPVAQRPRPLATAAPLAHAAKSGQYKSLMSIAADATAARKASAASSSICSQAAWSSSSGKQQQQRGNGEVQQQPGKCPNILYVY